MIKIENTQVFGWEGAIRGARNPMNSWAKSDSNFLDHFSIKSGLLKKVFRNILKKIFHVEDMGYVGDSKEHEIRVLDSFSIGPNDYKLLMNLCKGGTEEAKWRRMVHVQMDITAPLYWWKEFETYKVGTVSNSCSTMHKIHSKEFALEDFSCEHLLDHADIEMPKNFSAGATLEIGDAPVVIRGFDDNYHDMIFSPLGGMRLIVDMLNRCRELFLETKDKKYWWQMIQFLPSSFNQRRTIDLNYEVLASQYRQRKAHKLDEWREYCEWIKTLPYSEFITMKEE